MPEDYKRTVCGFCPHLDRCTEYRNKMWCGQCDRTLVCAMKEEVGRTDCAFISSRWQEALPSKCMLALDVLSTFVRASTRLEGAQEGCDGLIRDSHSQIHCPRCTHTTFTTNVHHAWEPFSGRSSKITASCSVCGLDVEFSLE